MGHYDVIVCGAGPGGSTTAAYLAMGGARVLLLDKAEFPRDKTCGDALGGKSLQHVHAIGAHEAVIAAQHYRYTAITMSSANGSEMTISLIGNEFAHNTAGYVVPRMLLDNAVFEAASRHVHSAGGDVLTSVSVKATSWSDGSGGPDPCNSNSRRAVGVLAVVEGEEVEFRAPVVVGAGGYNCPIAKNLLVETHNDTWQEPEHWSAAFREYYTNVEGCMPNDGAMEIHFIDDVIPGYFWIFPAGEGQVNVGTGMRLDHLSKRTEKLRAMQQRIIREHPVFKHRFANASVVEGSGKGWQLPLGSPRKGQAFQPRRVAGNGIFLVGDAASLIDPFTGEGIGNAMVSGSMVAELVNSVRTGKMSLDEATQTYQQDLWAQLGPELTNSDRLQKLLFRKRLMNWFIGRAAKKPKLQAILTDMLASKEAQEGFHSKWFILRALLF
jgi:geranylgeranyl reductase family protein